MRKDNVYLSDTSKLNSRKLLAYAARSCLIGDCSNLLRA